jgi:hypothetical protein
VNAYPPPRADKWDPWVVVFVFALLLAAAGAVSRL